jgi:hypothetical protein
MNRAPRSPQDLQAAFASLSESAVGGPDCPSPEAIWEAVTGAGSPAHASAVVEHTSRCFACAETWRLAREFGGRAIPEPGSAGSTPASRTAGLRTWTALAAAVVTLVGGFGVMMLRRGAPPIVMRAGEEVAIASLVPESAPLPREACVLKWSAPAGGARYTVRVGTEDLSPVALAVNLDRTEYKVEAKDLEKVPPGSAIVWRVEAVLPDGRRIASPGFRNRLE